MTADEEAFKSLVEAAQCVVERAEEQDDPLAGLRIVEMSVIALRDLLDQCRRSVEAKEKKNDQDEEKAPDEPETHLHLNPERVVYLRSMLASLESIEKGANPVQALHLSKPPNRLANPDLAVIHALLFVQVGQELDRRVQRGDTRMDKPVERAIAKVAQDRGVTVDVVQNAWKAHGATNGWNGKKFGLANEKLEGK